MVEKGQTTAFGEYVGIIRRRYIYLITILPAILLLSVYLSFALKPEFQATATILLETSSIPKEVVETTVVSYIDQQIEIVQGRVMTDDTLTEIVKAYDPYPDVRGLSVQKKAQRIIEDTSLERVDPVTMKPLAQSNAFSIHYNNTDPDRAVAVTSRLAQLFLTYNQRTRSEAAHEAERFLATQSQSISMQMRDIDAELAKLKSVHGDALPELQQRNEAAVDRTQRDLDQLQQQIMANQERESTLAVQLSQMSPNLITQSGDLTDVATVRAKLAEAEQRYTPDHPEVKRLKAALQTLMTSTVSSSTGIVADANNPQYLLTASQLESVRKTLANLRLQAQKTQGQENEYEELLRRTPLVETEYSEILRRKQSLQTEYQQINDKLQNAQLAQTFESEQRGERFTLLRAPYPPRLPVYPNRIGLILLGLVLGCGLAGVAVTIAESVDTNIRNPRDLPHGLEGFLLASIPFITNSKDRFRRHIIVGTFCAVYGVALLFVGAAVVSRLHH